MKIEIKMCIGLVISALTLATSGFCGNIDSPAIPSDDAGRMYTVEQIYQAIASGTSATKQSGGFNEPATGPASTMHTLDQIYAKIVTGTTTAAAGNVLASETFITRAGADSGEAMVTGTMTDREGDNASTAQAAAGGVNYFTAPAGYYDGDDRVSGTDAQVVALAAALTAGNVMTGATIFGVIGSGGGGGGLPKTGQVTQYGGELDDGYYQKGTARSYTDNGDGTVTDNVTGLMWELKTNDGTIHDFDTTYTWANAFDVFLNGAAGLNTVSFAGYADWRIPNVYELYSIALLEAGAVTGVKAAGAPYINQTVFGNAATGPTYYTKSGGYWSSTTYPASTGYALYVTFGGGNVNYGGKTGSYCVRAVRGGQ